MSVTQASQQSLLIIGDSLSAGYGIDPKLGWVNLLQQRLRAEKYSYTVINDSISGDTTSNGLTRLRRGLKKYRPKIVIIELGGNDGLRGISLGSMKKNLAEMIELVLSSGARVLLVAVPLPPNYGNAYIKKFESVYLSLASQYGICLVSEFLQGVGALPEMMQSDGIHPKQKAQVILLSNLWPSLEAVLKKETGVSSAKNK